MAFMKTAISIDEGLYDKAEKLSTKLHVSRSQLFSQAIEYLIEKNENLEIIKKLNELYNQPEIREDQEKIIKGFKKRTSSILEKW